MPTTQAEQLPEQNNPQSQEVNSVLTTLRTALEARETALEDLNTALNREQIDLEAFKAELRAHRAELAEVVANLETLLQQETEGVHRAALEETLGSALEASSAAIVLAFHQETDSTRRAELEADHAALEARLTELRRGINR